MEASLLHLIFHIAPTFLPQVSDNLAEHPFQGVVLHLPRLGLAWVVNHSITIITNVESSAIKVAAIFRHIEIHLFKFVEISLASEHTCHYDRLSKKFLPMSFNSTAALGTK